MPILKEAPKPARWGIKRGHVEQLSFKAGNGYFSFIRNTANLIPDEDLDRVSLTWKYIFKFIFETPTLDYRSIRKDLAETHETIKETDSWDFGFKFLILSYIHFIKTREDRFLDEAVDFCKDNGFFLETRHSNVRIHQPDIAFAYGIANNSLPAEILEEVKKRFEGNTLEGKISVIYYEFGRFISAYKSGKKATLPKEIEITAIEYGQRDDIPLQDIMISILISSGDVGTAFEKLVDTYFDGLNYLNSYFWERYGRSSSEPQSFELDPSGIYKLLIALRLIGLDKIQYVSEDLSERLDELIKFKTSPLIVSRPVMIASIIGVFTAGIVSEYLYFKGYISPLGVAGFFFTAIVVPNIRLIYKTIRRYLPAKRN